MTFTDIIGYLVASTAIILMASLTIAIILMCGKALIKLVETKL